jgi:hypothetical protein
MKWTLITPCQQICFWIYIKIFMKSYKLILLLQKLTRKELDEFASFLASPLSYQKTSSQRLLRFLQSFAPAFEAEAMTGEAAFEAMFGDLPYKHSLLKLEVSELFKQARHFLATLALEEQPEVAGLLSLRQLRSRQAGRVFSAELNALRKRLQKQPLATRDRLLIDLQLLEEEELALGLQQERKAVPLLAERMKALDTFYFYQKLQMGCELLNRRNILAEPSEPLLMAEVQRIAGSLPMPPVIRLYRLVYQSLAQPEGEQAFQQLKAELEKLSPELPPEEARALFKYAQNFCIRRINQGEKPYLEEIFQLYQQQLSSGILLDEGVISHTDYSNIVTTALRLRAFAWAEDFLHRYRERLLPTYRESLFRYNLANLYLEQDKQGEALRLLQDLRTEDPFYEASIKVLLAKVYVERKDWEALFYLEQAFRRFLRRQKAFSSHHRTHYLHFLKYLKWLAQLYERQPKLSATAFQQQKEKLARKLTEEEIISNRSWLERMLR